MVCFEPSCRYTPDAEGDINKLFGIGFLPGGHHKESARFGWRYSPEKDRIELFTYCYFKGRRKFKHLADLTIFKSYILSIQFLRFAYYFKVLDEHGKHFYADSTEPYTHEKKWGYKLGPYFGGDLPSPHAMTIQIRKV